MPKLNHKVVYMNPENVTISESALHEINSVLRQINLSTGDFHRPTLSISKETVIKDISGRKINAYGPSIDLGFDRIEELPQEVAKFTSGDGILFQFPLEAAQDEVILVDYKSGLYFIVGLEIYELFNS